MFSIQGLILMFMFGYGMAIVVEGVREMYKESKAIRQEREMYLSKDFMDTFMKDEKDI